MVKYRGQNISLVPSDGMKSEAERALAWKADGKRGGTRVGLARANQLKNKTELSPSTVRRMFSFFSRHEVDKQAQGFSPGEEGYPSPGRVAWALWGGDAGFSWSRAKVATMDRLDEKKSMHEEEEEYDSTEHSASHITPYLLDIADVGKKLHDMLGDEDNLPGHIISKVILATDYIRDARDYIKSEGYEKQLDEEYDYEGEMAKSEIRIMLNAVEEINGMLSEEVSLPMYVVSKVMLACTYVKDSYEYLRQEMQKAAPEDLKVGDYVSWNSSGGTARGKIKRVVKNGETGIQGISGTPEDPAAVIVVWRKSGDKYEASDVEVAHKFSTLRKIESLMKQDKIYTLMSKIKSVSEDSSTITIRGMASTTDRDRVGDVIESEAWTKGGTDNYLRNPIILFNHDHNRPIGRGTALRVTDKGLEITAKISKADPYIAKLIADGVLTTFSVGFKVKDADYIRDTGGLLIKDAELYEVSVVSIPANASAEFNIVKSYQSMEEFRKGLTPDLSTSVEHQEVKSSSKEIIMDEELKKLIAKAAADAVKMAEAEKVAADKAAKEETAKIKGITDAVTETVVKAGASQTEKLLEEVKKTFNDKLGATEAEFAKKTADLEGALRDRSEELKNLRESKRTFIGSQAGSDWQKAFLPDLRAAYLMNAVIKGKGGFDTKFGKEIVEKAVNTMSSVAVPSLSVEAFETTVSADIERDIQLGLVLAPLVREITMRTAVMAMPILPDAGYAEFISAKAYGTAPNTAPAPDGSLEVRDDTTPANSAGSPYSGIDLTSKTLSTKKLMSLSYLANETEEDTILAILPLINETMVRMHQRSVEHAMLLGGHSNGLLSGSFTGFAQHAATAAPGGPATEASNGASASYKLTAADLMGRRRAMGKYGITPGDVYYIVSQQGYFDLLEDPEFQDMNLVGNNAVKLTGEIGQVYGSKVLLCPEFKAAASGSVYALALNARNYVMPRLRGVTLESEYIPRLQHRELIATQRLGLETIISAAKSVASVKYAS